MMTTSRAPAPTNQPTDDRRLLVEAYAAVDLGGASGVPGGGLAGLLVVSADQVAPFQNR